MTRNELASELWELNKKRGICGAPDYGCDKEEWIRRMLKGCGAVPPHTKTQLEQAIKWAREDLEQQEKCNKLWRNTIQTIKY